MTTYSSGSATNFGYMVEWRLKPESIALSDMLEHGTVTERWTQAPYQIDQLGRSKDAARVIQPVIDKWDKDLSDHNLIQHNVATAVLACLQTSIESNLLEHVEWRIVKIEMKTTHILTRISHVEKN